VQETLSTFLPIVAIFVIFWLLVIRPASRRQSQVRALQAELAVGDKIITQGGIFGTIATVEDDRLGVEIADGVVIRIARPAVVAVEKPEPSLEEEQ
jgi:preprotein translocase subunit YajC